MNKLFSNQKNESGQGLVEYAIIIALVAIVVVASMKFLGPKLSCTYETVNNSLPGEGGSSGNCGTANADSESEPVATDLSCDVAAAKWQSTVGDTQAAMNAAGWPSSGPIYDNWMNATNEWLNSPERAYWFSNGC